MAGIYLLNSIVLPDSNIRRARKAIISLIPVALESPMTADVMPSSLSEPIPKRESVVSRLRTASSERLKFLSRSCANSINGLASTQQYLNDLLPGFVQLVDNQNMTLTYTVNQNSIISTALLQQFLPKPMGVGINVYIQSAGSTRTTSDGYTRVTSAGYTRITSSGT